VSTPGPNHPDKQRIVEALAEEWAAIADLCAGLSDEQWHTATDCPGWTVKDNVSHIIGTELALAGEKLPDVELADRSHLKNPIGEANELWIEARRGTAPADVLAEFRAVTDRRLAALRAMSQADFDADSWTPAGQATYGRFMQIRVFDCWMHEQDIREAVGLPGHEAGTPAEVSLDEITTAVGFLVGKRAGAPDGARVRIALEGGVMRELLVEVTGRAAVVPALSGPPTAEVTMPFTLFMRLCGGRTTAEAALADGTIGLGGPDGELARRIATSLPFTI
jgi:uncharacterized protein (TIGR03083 family)